jgi:hypothetical protein
VERLAQSDEAEKAVALYQNIPLAMRISTSPGFFQSDGQFAKAQLYFSSVFSFLRESAPTPRSTPF